MSTETTTAPPTHAGAWWRLLGAELRLIMGRRRNQLGLVILSTVPIVIAFAMRHQGNDIIGGVTNGLVVPLAALMVESVFFLPMAVAMLSGDSIAGEANSGTLRYLLTVPVTRTRLVLLKYVSLMIGALIGVGVVTVAGAVFGLILLGGGPSATLSGTEISFVQTLGRLGLVVAYMTLIMWAVAAIGLFFSTLVDQPMAVTVGVMVVIVLMLISQNFTQLAWLHPWTLTHWLPSFTDLLRDPPYWSTITRGSLLALGYIAVFVGAAWAHFAGKDISS